MEEQGEVEVEVEVEGGGMYMWSRLEGRSKSLCAHGRAGMYEPTSDPGCSSPRLSTLWGWG